MTPKKISIYFMLISVVVFSIEGIARTIKRKVKRNRLLRNGTETVAILKDSENIKGKWAYYEYEARGKTYLAKTKRDFLRENNESDWIIYDNDCPEKYIFKYGYFHERNKLNIKYTLELIWVVYGMMMVWFIADKIINK